MSRNSLLTDVRNVALKTITAAASLFVVGASAVWAQSTELTEGPSTRYPTSGIAVLDCAPKAPAPKESCVVRVPPGQLRDTLHASRVGEEKGKFEFARPGDLLFPKNLVLSETIVLIDLTPGPKGRRRATFKTEQKLIRSFVQSLPQGERIAIYGFNEKMHRLADFSTDRIAALNAIDALKLTGVNTRIATFSNDAIGILAGRDQAVLKNLFIVSDGEEEGTRNASEVTDAAIKANVSISALGMFWRPLGDGATAAGMDYLGALTKGTLGTSVQLQLNRAADSSKALTEFQSVLNASMTSSGLILPVGTAHAADITVTMKEPEPGVAGSYKNQDVKVRFTPSAVEATPEGEGTAQEAEIEAEQQKMLFGYPVLWVYAAAAALALLLLVLLLLLLRRNKPDEAFGDSTDIGFEDGGGSAEATRLSPPPTPRPAAAHAYLLNSLTRQKLPLVDTRATIGRGSTNSCVIDDDSVSRMHCEIVRNREGSYTVTDLDSLNGTFINGKKVAGVGQIKAGDEVKFGEVTTRLVLA